MTNRLFMALAITCSLVLLYARTSRGEASSDSSNLVRNPGFEEPAQVPAPPGWRADAWQGGSAFALDDSQAHSGQVSARIAASVANDARWIQTIRVIPHTRYVLSGWVKTRKVQLVDGPTNVGANLCLHDTWEHTAGVLGTADWTYQEMYFDSAEHAEVTISCRLGYWAGIVTGTMWCDDIAVRPAKMARAGPQQSSALEGRPNDRLFAHIYGAVAGAYIGNSMGAPVEGWTWERIEKTYGFLDTFVADPRSKGVANQPGWTEDGMERYKLMCLAIIKKGGRITIEELAREWVENIDPNKIGFRIGPQDRIIYDLLKAGMPPAEVGRYAIWPGFMGTAKMMQPLGLVNACRPDVAAKDALDLGRIKDAQGRPLWRDDRANEDGEFKSTLVYNNALENSAAIAAATAEAIRPNATVDSVIAAALAQLPPGSRKEVETVLGFAQSSKSWKDLRPLYQKYYEGRPISNAIDVLAGGLACFKLAEGRPREATLYAVNLGRDTDCKAYVAGGLAGALRGIDAWPKEWVALVERAVGTDPYTVDKRTARQVAEGLYAACLNETRKVKSQTGEIESLLAR